MSREEQCAMKEEIGLLCSGKMFQYSRKRILADKEEKHNELEERDINVVPQIEGISCIEEKEKYRQLIPKESNPSHPSNPTQGRLCIEPTTLCVALKSENLLLTLVVIEGRNDSSKGSQSSGSSMTT
jgi:hypothetical protein